MGLLQALLIIPLILILVIVLAICIATIAGLIVFRNVVMWILLIGGGVYLIYRIIKGRRP